MQELGAEFEARSLIHPHLRTVGEYNPASSISVDILRQLTRIERDLRTPVLACNEGMGSMLSGRVERNEHGGDGQNHRRI